MLLTHTITELRKLLAPHRTEGHTIGLVPTMGALHEGHLSLIRRSLGENAVTVVSIFLNPTQFNDKNDLLRYPSDLAADLRLLASLPSEGRELIAFAPSVEEMYPEPDTRTFSYPPTDTVMEGRYRPGHFNGVCQIVSKLFAAAEPDRAYFGEKDFQQVAVVRRMVDDLGMPLTIVPCPTVRGEGGLALSSRNALLTPEERDTARNIRKTLLLSRSLMGQGQSLREVHDFVVEGLNAVEGLRVQYFSIVDGRTLGEVSSWEEADDIVGCITVFCGHLPVRLIDHIRYKPTDNQP